MGDQGHVWREAAELAVAVISAAVDGKLTAEEVAKVLAELQDLISAITDDCESDGSRGQAVVKRLEGLFNRLGR